MIAAIRAEFRKLVSTRLWWILLLVMIVYLAFIAGVMSFSLTASTPTVTTAALSGQDAATTAYSLTNAVGYVFPLVLGSLMFTAEFRHKTITGSLLVEPRRGILLVAKVIVGALLGLVVGVVSTAATVVTAAPVLAWRGDGAYLGSGDVQAIIVFSVLVMAIWTVFGVALGGLITNQVAAIVVILAFTQFVEPIARISLGASMRWPGSRSSCPVRPPMRSSARRSTARWVLTICSAVDRASWCSASTS